MNILQKHEIAMMLIRRVEIQEDTTRINWKYDLKLELIYAELSGFRM